MGWGDAKVSEVRKCRSDVAGFKVHERLVLC